MEQKSDAKAAAGKNAPNPAKKQIKTKLTNEGPKPLQSAREPQRGRELVKFRFDGPQDETKMQELTLEDNGEHFNQFEAHIKRNNGVDKSTYNFEQYSSKIDKSKITAEVERKAVQMEKLLEGRGDGQMRREDLKEMTGEEEESEEMKFSGVYREDQPRGSQAKKRNKKKNNE